MTPLDPQTSRILDRYATLSAEIRRLEAEREGVREAMLLALGERRGTFATPRGGLRVLERPTARFDPTRLLAILDESRFLRDVALLQGPRVRRAMDANLAFARAVEPHVELATYTYVGPASP